MRRILVLGVLAALAWGQPAVAMVEDTAGVLTQGQAQALDSRLSQLGPHRFDVAFVQSGAAVSEAGRLFQANGLGSADGAIVVSMADRQVGVRLGSAFAERGVGEAAIQRAIQTRFAPLARQGDMAGAVAALASGLVQAGAASNGGAAAPGRAPSNAPGFPWWLVAIPVAGGAWMLMRRRGRSGGRGRTVAGRVIPDLPARLRALRTRQGQLLEGALKLDEASKLGKFAAGATADTYGRLARRAGTVLGETSAFGDRLDEADDHLKQGHHEEAEAIIASLESQVLPLASEVAAAVTGVDAMSDDDRESAEKLAVARARVAELKGRGVPVAHLGPIEHRLVQGEKLATDQDPLAALIVAEEVMQGLDRLEGRIVTIEPAIAWAELPDHAEDLGGRLQAMRETYNALSDRAGAIGVGADPMLENHLSVAERALTTAPVDLGRAKGAMASAQEALQTYIQQVESESDRRATLEAQQAQQTNQPMGGMGMLGPIILLNSLGSHVGHGGGYSGGESWGGGGFSGGGGDWGGGGSSGGGDW